MSKLPRMLLLIFFMGLNHSNALLAQYNNETVTEKSFEQSDLFFQSHYLSTFGLKNFRDASVGLINDPFLNLQLNPANLPRFETGNTHLYLDFRGDRTESDIVEDYGRAYPAVYNLSIYHPIIVDPRWYSNTRSEPEPVFSLGILTYPFGQKRNLFIGGTYQLIHKDEPFYSVPDWIYIYRFGFDALGNKVSDDNIPIVDRYAGTDEMSISGYLYSGFLGYRFTPRLSAGLNVDGVIHSRDGAYLNSYQDQYGAANDWDSRYLNSRDRKQDYDHFDFAGGLQYQFSPNASAGIKAGYLNGAATQSYNSLDSSYYHYDPVGNQNDWSYNSSLSATGQSWKQDGKNWYGRLNFSGKINPQTKLTAYYRYSKTDIDISNASAINDTAYYDSRWTWNDSVYSRNYYNSSLTDVRSGQGTREKSLHQAALNFEWELTPKNTLIIGVYYSNDKTNIKTLEPVSARFFSESFYYNSEYDPDTTFYLSRRIEDKELDWRYRSKYWTVQIPILTHFRFSEHWSMMLGINRILKSWEIEDRTTAYFTYREVTENGQTRIDTNFGERYTQPRQKISEDMTDFIASFEAAITKQFRVNLLLDPNFKDEFSIAQWWLSFRANL